MTIRTLITLIAAATVTPAMAADPPLKKWAPGHYIETADLSSADLRAKGVRGVLVRYQWADLEHDGIIDLSHVRADMAMTKAVGRSFGMILEDKRFNAPPNVRCVPDNLPDGQVVTRSNNGRYGCVSKRWIPAVSERWARFVRMVGQQLDSSDVVMVQNIESATSAKGAVPPADYLAHLRREAQAWADGWPSTPWAMSLNWQVPAAAQGPLVALISSLGGGMAHPDSVPPTGQPNQFDPFFASWKGRIVSAPLAENTFLNGQETLIGQRKCSGKPCTWESVAHFVVGYMGAHYAGWQRYAWGSVPFDFDRDLAPVLIAHPTVTACPSNIRCR
jgi:hypothetical protein